MFGFVACGIADLCFCCFSVVCVCVCVGLRFCACVYVFCVLVVRLCIFVFSVSVCCYCVNAFVCVGIFGGMSKNLGSIWKRLLACFMKILKGVVGTGVFINRYFVENSALVLPYLRLYTFSNLLKLSVPMYPDYYSEYNQQTLPSHSKLSSTIQYYHIYLYGYRTPTPFSNVSGCPSPHPSHRPTRNDCPNEVLTSLWFRYPENERQSWGSIMSTSRRYGDESGSGVRNVVP